MHESDPCPIRVKSKKGRGGEAAALFNPWESLQLEGKAVPTTREAQQPRPPPVGLLLLIAAAVMRA